MEVQTACMGEAQDAQVVPVLAREQEQEVGPLCRLRRAFAEAGV